MHALAHTIRLALLALLLITPWLFGGVWARVQWVLMLVVAMLLAAEFVSRFGDDDRPNLVPSAWLPVLLGVLLGLFQLVPWPPAMAAWFAPQTVQWRDELIANSADAVVDSRPRERVPRTIYPAITRQHLALLTLAFSVFVLASMHMVDRQTMVWFFAATAIGGAALSFFGLVQRLSWNGKFYWVFEPLAGGIESFGPFVNRNNAGGFLNLCLAAGLGLLIWVHWEPGRSTSRSSVSRGSRRGSREGDRRGAGRSRRRAAERRVGEVGPAPAVGPDPESSSEPASARSDQETALNDPAPATGAVSPGGAFPEDKRHGHPRRSSSRPGRRRSDGMPTDYATASSPQSYESSGRRAARASVRSVREQVSSYVADLDARRFGALALVAFMVGGVFSTASRGSILALFAAVVVTVAALALRRGNRGYAVGLLTILVAGGALMSWAGQTEFVRSRFAQAFEESQLERGRWPNWIEALHAVPEFPVAGSGLGTYPFVYERYQQRFLPQTIHRHAENQFIQALVEGGVLALGLLCAAILLTGWAIVRLYRTGGPVNTALAVAGTYGLISQLVGGLFDFGLYIPSNTMLMAALCGMVVGRAALLSVWPADALDRFDRPSSNHGYVTSSAAPHPTAAYRPLPDERQTVPGSTRSRRAYPSRQPASDTGRLAGLGLAAPAATVTLLVGFLMIGCLFGSLEMNRAGRIEAAMRQGNLERLLEQNQPEAMARAAAPLITALPQRWDDAEAHQHLALLLVAQYQSQTYHDLLGQQIRRDGQTPPNSPPLTEAAQGESPAFNAELWARASLPHLHRTLRQLERAGDRATAAQIVSSEPVQERLLLAARHFLAARQHAPTISRVHYHLAELTAISPELGDEQTHLLRAQLLSPGDATLLYWSGVLHLNSGRVDEACDCWRRSLLIDRLHLAEIVQASQGRLTVRQLLQQSLPPHADLLLRVAREFFQGEERAKIRQVFLERAEELLDDTPLSPAEKDYTHAAILNLRGYPQEAIPFYAAAVSQQSNNLNWRYEFARMLIELQQFDRAEEHIDYLIQARPESGPYIRLAREFNQKRWRAKVSRE